MSRETSDTQEFPEKSTFLVTGIALVVEERGKGARLVLRYPVTDEHLPSKERDAGLFFTLPPRVMAKLFRPKKPLCGQPMTISVGGTVFCCRAVLLEDKELQAEGDETESALVLFSVVVALTQSVPTSTIPISGWFDGDKSPTESPESAILTGNATASLPAFAKASKSFLAIRRVHVSLLRLCRVLEREERRCRYISFQAAHMIQINDDFHSLKETKRQNSAANSVNTTPSDNTKVRRHRRTLTPSSPSPSTLTETIDAAKPMQEPDVSVTVRQERDQEIFEIMMSAPSTGTHTHGNIAREMVHVYHALSRNDTDFPPTPSTLLSGRDGIVYINRHVAVPIEATSGISFLESMPLVRPYHTLLFPHSSAADLVASLPSSTARLQQLLVMTNPSKSLADIATDVALSLPAVMEMASFLVGHQACIASHVMTKSTVLACTDNAISRMQQFTLDFSEQFYHLSIFTVVSILTSKGLTLGELIKRTTSGQGEESELVGSILSAVFAQAISPSQSGIASTLVEVDGCPIDSELRVEETTNSLMGETLFAMAVWLRAKNIVVAMNEYFVSYGLGAYPAVNWKEDSHAASQDADTKLSEEQLFMELLESNCLNGNISSVAMCWKFGLDKRRLHRLREWGLKTGRINTFFRTPREGDDWEV